MKTWMTCALAMMLAALWCAPAMVAADEQAQGEPPADNEDAMMAVMELSWAFQTVKEQSKNERDWSDFEKQCDDFLKTYGNTRQALRVYAMYGEALFSEEKTATLVAMGEECIKKFKDDEESFDELLNVYFFTGIAYFLEDKDLKKSEEYLTLVVKNSDNDKQKAFANIYLPKMTVKPGRPAPEVELIDLDGKEFKLSDCRGKVVLIDYYLTTCPRCLSEIPHLVDIYEKYKDEEDFVMISAVFHQTGEETLKKFLKESKAAWRHALVEDFKEQARVLRAVGANGSPYSILVGPDGVLLSVDERGAELEKTIDAELAKLKLQK